MWKEGYDKPTYHRALFKSNLEDKPGLIPRGKVKKPSQHTINDNAQAQDEHKEYCKDGVRFP